MTWNRKIQQEARQNRFKGGLILGLVVFLSLSFWSYNPEDPSLNSFGLSLKVTNYCGFIGASLADLFYQLFGGAAWLFVFGGLWLSFKFFTNRFRESLSASLVLFGLFLLAVVCLGELHFSSIHFFNDHVGLGGAIGKVLVSILKPLLHTVGTAVVLWSALLLVLIFYSQTLFAESFWFYPKKLLIRLSLLAKRSPEALAFIGLNSQKLYQKSLEILKLLPGFFKGKWLFLSSLFLKIQRKFPSKEKKKPTSPAPEHTKDIALEKEGDKARFVFEESSPLKSRDFAEDSSPREEGGLKASLSPQSHSFKETSDSLSSSSEDLPGKKQFQPEVPSKAPSSSDKASFRFSELPSIDLLSDPPSSSLQINQQDVEELSKKLLSKLGQFSIQGEITAVKTGPALVLFEFKPEDHVKVNRIREMESDLSLALSSESIRIIAPIPGRDVVGIEASMPHRKIVYLKELLKEKTFFQADLPLVLGRRADNVIGIKDLARTPHLLVAGTTGSGKSMFIISFVSSLLFRHTPETLRILLIDPKQVDLSAFKDVPHLLSPIITSSNKAVGALLWAIQEMEKRYRSLALFKARDHKSFNSTVRNMSAKDKKSHREKQEEASPQESYYFEPLPLICVVIEEFGDLMADRNIRKSIENSVVRLAQKARASGIHLVLAMQSPRKDVLTGLIKTNIPGRISFKVTSGTDSRVILDETGAERLLSHGDMLFLEPGSLKPTRYHGPLVREKEVAEIVKHWKSQGEPFYEEALINKYKKSPASESRNEERGLNIKEDPMYDEIVEYVKGCKVVSASFLQRKFRIGYPRAARIIEILCEEGKIGPPQGSKPREVLIHK